MRQQQFGGWMHACDARFLLALQGPGFRGGRASAPSLTIAGAYFPAWLACAVLALVATAGIRGIMVASGLARFLPFQLAICVALGALVGLGIWYWWVMA